MEDSPKNKIVSEELEKWLNEGSIPRDVYDTLSPRYQGSGTWDFQTIAKWTLLVGAVLLGIGLISLLILVFNSLIFLAVILSAFAGAGFYFGFQLLRSGRRFFLPKSGNSLLILGCFFLGADIFTLAKILVPKGDEWPPLLLLTSLAYFGIGYAAKSPTILIMGLLGLATWFGTESGYMSGWGAYFLGLNYPLRFALVSPFVVLAGYLHKRWWEALFPSFSKVYYAVGLLYVNLSLWILSIFGNEDKLFFGDADRHLELLAFSGLWLLADVFFFVLGTRFRNRQFVSFAVVFVILNLYTRYFEYFWDALDKWIFFIVLGAVTLIGGVLLEQWQKRRKAAEAPPPVSNGTDSETP